MRYTYWILYSSRQRHSTHLRCTWSMYWIYVLFCYFPFACLYLAISYVCWNRNILRYLNLKYFFILQFRCFSNYSTLTWIFTELDDTAVSTWCCTNVQYAWTLNISFMHSWGLTSLYNRTDLSCSRSSLWSLDSISRKLLTEYHVFIALLSAIAFARVVHACVRHVSAFILPGRQKLAG